MKIALPFVFAAILLAAGCSRSRDEKSAATPAVADSTDAKASDAKAPDNILRIGPAMLRDQRLTTTVTGKRRPGDGVNLLGDVTVNEDAFFQVGAPLTARIVSIAVSPGQQVARGQALAVLQSAELGKANSESIAAQARLRLAQQTLERKRRLAEERIVAQRDVQEAEAAVASAEAALRAARTALRALGAGENGADGADGSMLTLRAPIAGTVIERTALNGQQAEPAQTLFKIAGLKTLWLNVHAFERDAVHLRAGTAAKVTLPAWPGRTFPAHVALIGSVVDPVSHAISIRIETANAEGALRPGMAAMAFVPFADDTGQTIQVPAVSVQRVDEEWFVFIPRSQGVFEMRPVERGRNMEGEIEIVKGLKAGETVVVEGAFLLKAEAEKARGEGKEHD